MSAPALTRRALIGATAAAGALALPVTAEAGIPAAHPDAGLLDLIRRHGEAVEAVVRATVASDEAWCRALAAYPPRPEGLRWRPGDFPRTAYGTGAADTEKEDGSRWYGARGAEWLRGVRPAPHWPASSEARRREIVEAWDGYVADRHAVEDRVGFTALGRGEDAAGDLVHELACEVKRSRPETLAGLRALAAWFGQQAEAGAAHDDSLALLAAAVAGFGGAAT